VPGPRSDDIDLEARGLVPRAALNLCYLIILNGIVDCYWRGTEPTPQPTWIVFFAMTSELRIGVQPAISWWTR